MDGTTQSGYTATTPMIELDGSQAGASADGFTITAGGSTIRGLVINDFDYYAIDLDGVGGNTIEGNFIGTEPDGTTAAGNYRGILIRDAGGSQIGGVTANARNLVSGNNDDAIIVYDGADSTVIQGNYVGTNVSGSTALANGDDGIVIADADNVIIGGTDSGAGNLVSGNADYGIIVHDSSLPTNTVIQGNYVGVDAAGTYAIANGDNGILVGSSYGTAVGGSSAEAGNLVSGNAYDGILVYYSASDALIRGNTVGMDATGTQAIPNGDDGIDVRTGSNITITGNLISGNPDDGISVHNSTNSPTNTVIRGNMIGTDIDGDTAVGNGDNGINVGTAVNTTIGGSGAGEGNLISGNGIDGIRTSNVTDTITIQGNYIGTDSTGSAAIPNGDEGVDIDGADNVTIGGTVSGARNVISGNLGNGIDLEDWTAPVSMTVQGNYIGVDASGATALGNGLWGIVVGISDGVVIGGADVNARNVISGNGYDGIVIYDAAANALVRGNYIGTNASGTQAIPNGDDGIDIREAADITIGGATAGAGNLIAYNLDDGIVIYAGDGMVVSGNIIYENGGMGIDLGGDGVTANDSGDIDTGPNNLQNYPILSAASSDGVSSSTIDGSLNSTASTTFRVEFFASATCDASGSGEEENYLGGGDVITDANGDVSFSINLATGISDGSLVTSTATDPDGNTSEFSPCQSVVVTSPAQEEENYSWHYDYDPLYRLTYACSDWDAGVCTGDEFSYTYDAVGNRLSQTINGVTNVYTYDAANRLTGVDGVTYIWDNNGNLLNDGTNTYTYDYANRLVALTDGVDNYTYQYTGLVVCPS